MCKVGPKPIRNATYPPSATLSAWANVRLQNVAKSSGLTLGFGFGLPAWLHSEQRTNS